MLRAIKKYVPLDSYTQLERDLIKYVSLAGYKGSRRLFGRDILLLVCNVQQAPYFGLACNFLFFLMITFNPNTTREKSKKSLKLFFENILSLLVAQVLQRELQLRMPLAVLV